MSFSEEPKAPKKKMNKERRLSHDLRLAKSGKVKDKEKGEKEKGDKEKDREKAVEMTQEVL